MRQSSKKTFGIHPRGSRWIIETTYRGHRIFQTFATREAAECSLQKIKTLIDEGRYLEKKEVCLVTLGEFTRKYLSRCETTGQKTIYGKGKILDRFIRYFGAKTRLDEITLAKVEAYQEYRKQNPERRKTIGPYGVNREVATLRAMLQWAVKTKVLKENPIANIEMLAGETRSEQFFNAEEAEKLISSIEEHPIKEIITLALFTGMRRSEILSLRWSQVKLNAPCPYIELPVQKKGEWGTVPLAPTAISVLKAIPRQIDSAYVFPSPVNPKGHLQEIRTPWAKALKNAGFDQRRFHSLRHSTASIMTMNGVPLGEVSAMLRHSSESITKRFYSHLTPEHRNSIASKLESALSTKKGEKSKTG